LCKERHTSPVLLYGADVHEHEGARHLSAKGFYEGSWIFPFYDLHNATPVPPVPFGHHYRIEERHMWKTRAIRKFISLQFLSPVVSAWRARWVTDLQKPKRIEHRDATDARGTPDADATNPTPSRNCEEDRSGHV
jgi:hypothetical protein